MWETILITGAIVAIAFVLLAVKVIFVKGGKFPNTHLSGNPGLKKQGIGCAKSMDREAQNRKTLLDLIEDK
ncbi:MAG: hypothetical protein RR202_09765 [Bacteroidales bacterium]